MFLILFTKCTKDFSSDKPTQPSAGTSICDAVFPTRFDFSTMQIININLIDAENVVYRVYGKYKNERDLISSGSVHQGAYVSQLEISSHYEAIELERWQGADSKSNTYNVSPGSTTINSFSSKKGKAQSQSSAGDILYGINSLGGFFTIDLNDYSSTSLPNPIQGSIALAVDTVNDIAYYHRHPNMYAYDINTGTHSTHGTYAAPFNSNYPRMEFNHNDGYLYVAKNSTIHVIDPSNGTTINTYSISGIVNTDAGGDLAFPPNGNIYLSCFSGLYELTLNGTSAQATRLSAENFPFQLTSLGYDRNSFLYAGTSDSNSKLIKIDPADGAWVIVKTFNHTINDLGSVSCPPTSIPQIDTDGDGVIDDLDVAPNDADIAHAQYTPSVLGNGSLGFEDLWPSKGDYDFNDLVVRYRYIKYLNSANQMVKLEAKFQIKAIGASMHNGFGIELDCDPSLIESVTGTNLTKGIVTTDSKGLESGSVGKSTIVVFDDAFDNIAFPMSGIYVNTEPGAPTSQGDTLTVLVKFQQPVAEDAAGDAPFNPFMFIDGNRGREVHLADQLPTFKMNPAFLGTLDDDSQPASGKYYKSDNNVPWAINISHEFRHPLEKKRIDEAYNHFVNWAISSGSNYPDWYKDNSGYRNTSKLYLESGT